MPIEFEIDHDRRLVLARGHGVLIDSDVFGYQRARSDVPGLPRNESTQQSTGRGLRSMDEALTWIGSATR
jgi:hypothetical protein